MIQPPAMSFDNPVPSEPADSARDKRLFTPGPLTTSASVKQAMLRDVGSRDEEFLAVVREVRERLLATYGLSQKSGWEAVLLPGSGTSAVEALLSSLVPREARVLALVNGAYGQRITRICAVHGIPCEPLRFDDNAQVDPAAVERALAADRTLTHVALVHVETTTGVLNPLDEVGRVVREHGRTLLVDAMSSFGALPIAFEDAHVEALAASANKCLEGVPGLAFVLARRGALEASGGRARTLTLDLHAQWRGLEDDGQFRFTPPTQVVLALRQALLEHENEGGVAGRGARYRANHDSLRAGMEALGFQAHVPRERSSPIIATFLYPRHPRWDFPRFYERLSERGFLIYPGKLTRTECFRVGNIGRLFPRDVAELLQSIAAVLGEMGVELCARG